jgi:hypothetical protein
MVRQALFQGSGASTGCSRPAAREPASEPGTGRQSTPDPGMHPGLSFYLDLIRFISALEVFLYHIGLARFGHEAVIVFFVLSGYVISYTAKNNDRTIGRYAISRFTRVYSVALPALVGSVEKPDMSCVVKIRD